MESSFFSIGFETTEGVHTYRLQFLFGRFFYIFNRVNKLENSRHYSVDKLAGIIIKPANASISFIPLFELIESAIANPIAF